MDEVRCEFIPGVSQPTFLQIQRAVPELLAIPGHHHRCRETVNEDRVYVYDNGLRAIVGQGVKDPGGVKYERKVVYTVKPIIHKEKLYCKETECTY